MLLAAYSRQIVRQCQSISLRVSIEFLDGLPSLIHNFDHRLIGLRHRAKERVANIRQFAIGLLWSHHLLLIAVPPLSELLLLGHHFQRGQASLASETLRLIYSLLVDRNAARLIQVVN